MVGGISWNIRIGSTIVGSLSIPLAMICAGIVFKSAETMF